MNGKITVSILSLPIVMGLALLLFSISADHTFALWASPQSAPTSSSTAPAPSPTETTSGDKSGPAESMANPASWMSPPPPGPTEADQGAFTYWMRCMVCHGDKGQGLAVFRYSYPKNDQNCSSTKCHGGPYPPAGFGFPDAPAIIGDGTLARFQTAADLYAFVSTRMPYQAPAELSSQEYWNVVAYLLQERGAIAPNAPVGAANANGIPVHPRRLPGWAGFAAAGGLALIAGTAVWLYRTRRARS